MPPKQRKRSNLEVELNGPAAVTASAEPEKANDPNKFVPNFDPNPDEAPELDIDQSLILKAMLMNEIVKQDAEASKSPFDRIISGIVNLVRGGAHKVHEVAHQVKEKTKEVVRHVGGAALKAEHAIVGSYYDQLAMVESSGNDLAHAKTSSAAGRYQFTEGTWLSMVKRYGPAHGGKLAEAATHITIGRDGRPHVDAAYRQDILDMRYDPNFSQPMIRDFTNSNVDTMQAILGRSEFTRAELYMAHFLGPTAAARFIRGRHEDRDQPAINCASAEAVQANRNVFYTKSGRAKTVGEVYDNFAAKFPEPQNRPTMLAQAKPKPGELKAAG